MIPILQVLCLPALAILIIFLAGMSFICAGYIISKFLLLSLFQSSALCIASTFVISFTILGGMMMSEMVAKRRTDNFYDDYDDDDNYDDDDDYDNDFNEKHQYLKGTIIGNLKKPGRNTPCPCGSGKKYKHCCGK